jgi:hypothetical protein
LRGYRPGERRPGDAVEAEGRVYHESFQRYVRDRLLPDLGVDVEAVVAPAIQWLERRGFFSDKRAFRSLLGLLRTQAVTARFLIASMWRSSRTLRPAVSQETR